MTSSLKINSWMSFNDDKNSYLPRLVDSNADLDIVSKSYFSSSID